jgi:hypothetical protein
MVENGKAAQGNEAVAMNTESTSRTERRSESNKARKSHESRVIQSERCVTTREREAQGAHAPTQFTCFIVGSIN